jgi:hypothetical protein
MHDSIMMSAGHLCCIGVAVAPLAGGFLAWLRWGGTAARSQPVIPSASEESRRR